MVYCSMKSHIGSQFFSWRLRLFGSVRAVCRRFRSRFLLCSLLLLLPLLQSLLELPTAVSHLGSNVHTKFY